MQPETLDQLDAWWRAANYLAVGQIYLLDNPLLREPLRREHTNVHVRGYKDEGTTTSPFDMVMMNDPDRYHLVIDVLERVPEVANWAWKSA